MKCLINIEKRPEFGVIVIVVQPVAGDLDALHQRLVSDSLENGFITVENATRTSPVRHTVPAEAIFYEGMQVGLRQIADRIKAGAQAVGKPYPAARDEWLASEAFRIMGDR